MKSTNHGYICHHEGKEPMTVGTCGWKKTLTPDDLAHWRALLKISRAEACRRLGISPNYWTKLERGLRPIPRTLALACAAVVRGILPWPK